MKKTSFKKLFGLIFAVLAIIIGYILPTSAEVTRTGLLALAVFFGVIVMWICETMPMSVSALLLIFLMPALGIMNLNTVFPTFGGTSFFFAIATFFVSGALENTSVPLRICRALAKLTKGDSRKLVIALFFASAITSAIMSNLSTCIIYMNLSLALLRANNCDVGKSNMGKCLMIGIPATAGVGGLITPAGTPGNALIMGLLEGVGIELTFMSWTLLFAPLALLTVLICGIWCTMIFKPEPIDAKALEALDDKLRECGNFTKKEIKTVVIIVVMLICWLLGTWVPVLNVTVVAIVGMAVLFMPGIDILEWKTASKKVNWDLCFTMGAVGVFISALTNTGIMGWLVQNLFSGLNSWNIYVMFFVIGLVVCVIRAFIPTAPAIAALFGAPLLAAAAMTGASPVALLAIPAFWACAPMLLWIEPIFLFSYGYNYYKPLDVLKYGSVPCLILIALMSFLPNYVALFGF